MKKQWGLILGILLVCGLGFITCATVGSTTNEVSYDFKIYEITSSTTVATIRATELNIDFIELPDSVLKDPSEFFPNITDLTDGLKIFEIKLVGGQDLVLDLADTNKDRMTIWYANKAGSFKTDNITLTFSGKGWNWIQPADGDNYSSIVLDNNHNPNGNYKWTVFQKGNVIWSGTAENGTGVPKSLTITGVGGNEDLAGGFRLMLSGIQTTPDFSPSTASADGSASGDSVTVQLKTTAGQNGSTPTSTNWTGTGSYYVRINTEAGWYLYGGNTEATAEKINFVNEITTVEFSKFSKSPQQ